MRPLLTLLRTTHWPNLPLHPNLECLALTQTYMGQSNHSKSGSIASQQQVLFRILLSWWCQLFAMFLKHRPHGFPNERSNSLSICNFLAVPSSNQSSRSSRQSAHRKRHQVVSVVTLQPNLMSPYVALNHAGPM